METAIVKGSFTSQLSSLTDTDLRKLLLACYTERKARRLTRSASLPAVNSTVVIDCPEWKSKHGQRATVAVQLKTRVAVVFPGSSKQVHVPASWCRAA